MSIPIFKLEYYFVDLWLYACGYPVISTLRQKDCTFPTELSWHSCQKSFDYIYKSLFPFFLFCCIVLCVSPYALTHCCDRYSLVVNFEIRKFEPSYFVLF